MAAVAADILDGLQRHIAKFDDPATPYRPARRDGFSYAFDTFAHLARIAEWSAVEGDSTDGDAA